MSAPPGPRAVDGLARGVRARASTVPDRAWVIALIVVGAIVSWFRIEPAARGALWAEDGTFFLGDAVDADPVSVLLTPYQGYLHLVPRVLAGLTVGLVPVEGWAIAMTVGSCLVVGGVAATVFVCARGALVWLPARLMLAALTFLAPEAGYEVLGNAANLHWYALWLAPWLLLAVPRRRATAVLLGAVGLVAALTEIQMILFLPLLAWRYRDPNRWIVGGGVVIGSAMQLVALALAPRTAGAETSPPILSTVQGYLYHVPMAAVFPSRQWKASWVIHFGWWGAVLVLVPFLVALTWVLWRGVVVERVAGAALAIGSVATWSAAYVLNADPVYFFSLLPPELAVHLHLTRYGVVPALYLLAIVVMATSVAWREEVLQRIAAVVLIGVLALTVVAATLPQPSVRGQGPEWMPEVTRSRNACAVDREKERIAIAIAPDRWRVRIGCDRLAG